MKNTCRTAPPQGRGRENARREKPAARKGRAPVGPRWADWPALIWLQRRELPEGLRETRGTRSTGRANDARRSGRDDRTSDRPAQSRNRGSRELRRKGRPVGVLDCGAAPGRHPSLPRSPQERGPAPHRKPLPLYRITRREPCPVCGHPSYSASGIHPQCVEVRSQINRVKRAYTLTGGQAAKTPTAGKSRSPWYRPCPRCARLLHVRRLCCDCGQSLARPPAASEPPAA